MEKTSGKPTCSKCGATGTGAVFSVFSKFGFGKYCVPCEDILATEFQKAHVAR
jgi:hypothetical protein